MKAKRKINFGWLLLIFTIPLLAPLPAASQDHGSGGGGGCGDVFGDLIHILRDNTTGQPILAQRWIELPAELQGYGWGYCPIPVYDNGVSKEEIPFLPYSCDIDPAYLDLVEEVNYFGRLNGGRTKERNHRMHLDEVISNIKAADTVKRSPTGRMMLGFDCNGVGKSDCTEWLTIDSPMESMALYTRIMKYGHLGTDPYEIDTWAHGDPKLATQFHPALGEEDWPKFHNTLKNILPGEGKIKTASCWDYNSAEWYDDANDDGVWNPAEPFFDINKNGYFDAEGPPPEPFSDLNDNGLWDDAEAFTDDNGNGVADEFVFLCADPETLSNKDFLSGSALLAAAASKTGDITIDLVQFGNRILKITKKTEHTESTLDTLPALYRDCWDGADPVDPPEAGGVDDPPYLTKCEIVEASELLTPEYALYPEVQERFVDFSGLTEYEREYEGVHVILDKDGTGLWSHYQDEPLLDWVELVNGDTVAEENIKGFVAASKDFLRAIEFVHNFDPPANLYCTYAPAYCL